MDGFVLVYPAFRNAGNEITMRGCKCKGAVLSGTSLGVSLLPKGTCPLCWPAYAALLSAVGVRADILNRYPFPLTAGLVGLALPAIGWRASQRNGYGPVILATLASIVLLTEKFLLNDPGCRLFWIGFVCNGFRLERPTPPRGPVDRQKVARRVQPASIPSLSARLKSCANTDHYCLCR